MLLRIQPSARQGVAFAPSGHGRTACHHRMDRRRTVGRAARVRLPPSSASARDGAAGGGPSRDDSWDESEEGDKDVQRMLEAQLSLETGKARVDQYVEEELERFTAITEEGKSQLDALQQANEARSALEFGQALADIEQEDDVDALIAAVKATAEEVESNLNSGLPFKALYSSKVPLSSEQQRRVGKEELDALDAVTNKELGQRWRTLSYGAIALALFGLSAAALAKDSAVGKAMFALFLLVFAALAAQVFVEQDKLLASRPFDPDDDDM